MIKELPPFNKNKGASRRYPALPHPPSGASGRVEAPVSNGSGTIAVVIA
ncbi:MAG: hypothetical protein OEM82_05550 [Acidobacteriota bacterium]|nr:hypothetical protein [Acidobacteriota bacterium]MDH3529742.1 hypothetical protein [Acidobacteriota bacterium]